MPGYDGVTHEEILAVIDGKRLVAASDVADTVGLTRKKALWILKDLRDEGRVNHKYVRANGDMWGKGGVWWTSTDTDEDDTDEEPIGEWETALAEVKGVTEHPF